MDIGRPRGRGRGRRKVLGDHLFLVRGADSVSLHTPEPPSLSTRLALARVPLLSSSLATTHICPEPCSRLRRLTRPASLVLQDIVTRHAHSTGHHVERRFGWDTHGLPVEHEIDKKLGITGKADVMKMGIEKYNEECRAIVRFVSSFFRLSLLVLLADHGWRRFPPPLRCRL